MTNFGNYAILNEVVHHFELEPEWYWKIKPVSSEDELDMSKFLAHRRIISTREGRFELPPTWMEIAFREIAMSFAGTNIPADKDKPVEKGGEPLIPAGAAIEEIEAKLGAFPPPMFMEIWRAVGNAYPQWGPLDPNPMTSMEMKAAGSES